MCLSLHTTSRLCLMLSTCVFQLDQMEGGSLKLFYVPTDPSLSFSHSSSSNLLFPSLPPPLPPPPPPPPPPPIISESLQPLSGVCTGMHLFWTQRRGLAGLPCQKWPLCDWLSISRYASIMNNSGVQNHVSSRICSVSVSSSPF